MEIASLCGYIMGDDEPVKTISIRTNSQRFSKIALHFFPRLALLSYLRHGGPPFIVNIQAQARFRLYSNSSTKAFG